MNRKHDLRPSSVVTYCTKASRTLQYPRIVATSRSKFVANERRSQPGGLLRENNIRKKEVCMSPKVTHFMNAAKKRTLYKAEDKSSVDPRNCQDILPTCKSKKTDDLICDDCGKRLGSRYKLEHHRKVHTGENIFICKTCDEAFRTRVTLRSHQMLHSGEKPFVCDVCGKSFGRNAYLFEHKLIHTDERPFVCKVCNKAFRYSGNLRTHRKIHTFATPAQSDTCDRVQTGLKQIHRNDEARTYTGEPSSRLHPGLKAAQTEHHPLPKRPSLKSLVNIYLSGFPFKCTRCQRSFNHFSHLEKHIQYHT